MARGSEVALGRIGAPHGVRGWVKIRSDTEPPQGIFEHPGWVLEHEGRQQTRKQVLVREWRAQGSNLTARLEGVSDRDAAARLAGHDILVARELLAPLEEGEFYWCDLLGAEVITVDGVALGRVQRVMETGANDVLVVRAEQADGQEGGQEGERERLIPFVMGSHIRSVELPVRAGESGSSAGPGRIEVDWDPEF